MNKWKIYFWFISSVNLVYAIIFIWLSSYSLFPNAQFFGHDHILPYVLSLVAILPVYAIAYRKAILNINIWKILLVIQIVALGWLKVLGDESFAFINLIIILVFSIPLIYANYLYVYKFDDVWENKKTRNYPIKTLFFLIFLSFALYFYIIKSNGEIPFCQGEEYFKAADNGDISQIRICLMFGKDINSTLKRSYDRKITALHLAGYSGRYNVAKYLIDNGADINYKSDKNGVSPLWYSSSHLKILKLLIENGAEINDSDHYGSATFSKAARRTNIDILEYLLSKGAKLNSEGAICNAVSTQYKNTIKTVSFLIKRGIDINAKTKHGSTALDCAMNKQPQVVQLLIKSGANLDDEDRYGRTPVFNANERFIDYLINAGANVNYVSKNGDTPLFASFALHDGKTTVPLIKGGANVNIRNDYYLTPLIVAAITSTNDAAIKYLIDSGADESISASIDMINEYSKLFRKKALKTDKIELTAYDIAVIKWGKNNSFTNLFKIRDTKKITPQN